MRIPRVSSSDPKPHNYGHQLSTEGLHEVTVAIGLQKSQFQVIRF